MFDSKDQALIDANRRIMELERNVERMRQTLFWIAHAEVDRHYPSAETLREHARKAIEDLGI